MSDQKPQTDETPTGAASALSAGLGGHCLICGKPVADYEPEMCCSGYGCACRGEPMNPCTCSVECENALFDGIGKSYDQRRIDAGIQLWTPNAKNQGDSGGFISGGSPALHG